MTTGIIIATAPDGGRYSHLRDQFGDHEPRFSILMEASLVDELDEQFSPMDGIVAIDQLFYELPRLHPGSVPKRGRKRAGRRLKVYRARYRWSDLGLSYVQLGTTLHVLDLWYDDDYNKPNRQEVDVVLGRNPAEEDQRPDAQP
jgi:hypothetical protein